MALFLCLLGLHYLLLISNEMFFCLESFNYSHMHAISKYMCIFIGMFVTLLALHARIQREGGRGPDPPEKSQKYRVS